LSVDPLVDVTGTPYVFTGGDPVNGSDSSGLTDCGLNPACYAGSAFNKLKNFGAEHSSGFCNQLAGGLLGGVTGCNKAKQAETSCRNTVVASTYDEDIQRLKANNDALEKGYITPGEWRDNLFKIIKEFRQGEQYFKRIYDEETDVGPGGEDGGDIGVE
jgi:hypothetical protein